MAKMPKDVMDMFNDPSASKVLGTIDEKSVLNVAPIGTVRAIDGETIAFAVFMEERRKRIWSRRRRQPQWLLNIHHLQGIKSRVRLLAGRAPVHFSTRWIKE
ncbi:MAG TPA: hypothetical protein VMW67_01795 [Desulfobacteria bacterium]|nr:hypothetical protein [Desulfobacteria bacterium]